MTKKQYFLLLDLYHEFNAAFISLDSRIQDAYYAILMGKAQPTDI
jgi:hypothetical protein